MTLKRIACVAVALASLAFALAPASAEDAISHPAKKPIGPTTNEMVPSLAVLNAHGATLEGNKLTLTGVTPNSILFADRPVRSAGHVLTSHFIKEWDVGNDSFAKDPPNATISVFSEDGLTVKDAVVVLKSPKMDGDRLTFDVQVLEGDLAGGDGPASVFIDIIGLPFTPLSFAGVARRTAYRAAWYGGAAAAAGAAAAYYHPYYHPYAYPPPAYYRPPCGYYPLPPCY
jgi:hypothetical protein